MKETNFLKFTGDVNISQFNFAGIGQQAMEIREVVLKM